jgi:hypothetical protein
MFPKAAALVIYTDGGPDHNNKHQSVRLGLLSLFMELDLDTMVVMRTAPTQSWGNPVERVMSVLNLGLQGVALARDELVGGTFEKEFKKCNGMSAVRLAAKQHETNVVEHDPNADFYELDEEERKQEEERLMQHRHEEEEELLLLMREEEDHNDVLAQEDAQFILDEIEGIEVAPDVGNHDDDMWDVEPEPGPEVAQPRSSTSSARSPSETNQNPFIVAYMRSIQPARDIICGQWRECEWDEKSLIIEAPSTSDEVRHLLNAFPFVDFIYINILLFCCCCCSCCYWF